jgi:predicted transcriptional regulator
MQVEESNRLKEFAEISYGSLSELSRHLKKTNNFFSSYISNPKKYFGWRVLKKLYEAGLNIDWLISGYGSMFSNSKIGLQLQKERSQLINQDDLSLKLRLELDSLKEKINTELDKIQEHTGKIKDFVK